MIRKLKNEFKQPIYKEDMIPVLKRGILYTLIYACLLGVVDALLYKFFNMSLSLLIFVLGYIISSEVSKNYYSKHILYPIISVLFLFVGMIILYSVSYFMMLPSISFILPALKLGLIQTFYPFNIFIYFNSNNIFNNILYLLILLYTIYTTFRNTKNNYY